MKVLLLCFTLAPSLLFSQTPKESVEDKELQQIDKERDLWEKQEQQETLPGPVEEEQSAPIVNLQCVCPPSSEPVQEEEIPQDEESEPVNYLPPGQSDYQYVDPVPDTPLRPGDDRIYLGIP